jgi:transposase
VAEQRYQAVLAVIAEGLSVSQVADKVGVSRQTLHAWLARYEAEGLAGLADRSTSDTSRKTSASRLSSSDSAMPAETASGPA